MSKFCKISPVVVAAIAALTTMASADYKIDWYSINSGGGCVSGGNFMLDSSVGQACAGFVSDTSYLHWIGFWAGGVPVPVQVNSATEAKTLPDGTFVSMAGKIATSAQGDFEDFFYIEEETRTSGIRVAASTGVMAGLLRGHVVNVIGTLGTTDAGERQFTGPVVVIVAAHDPLVPLGMPNLWVGGADFGTPPFGQYGVTEGSGLNTVGLLIATWGRVIDAGAGYAVIDDGSGKPVRVDTTTLADAPGMNEYVTVIGVSSLYKPDANRLRLVLPRDDADITRP